MRHIKFPDNIDVINRRLPFFLATEEWVARTLPAGDYFFSWQVDPTVICGRNQEIPKEVDLNYCNENGIDVVRRRSGGGAVFADRENFMFSYITDGDDITKEFAHYTSIISDALRNIGIQAEATGRNDITIDGRKVAGNAFYHIPGRCIAHGTMLYNFDPIHISRALTPSRAKLESKGVKSVQSRITCLKHEGISLSPKEFENYMIHSITDGDPYVVTSNDLKEILKIEKRYYDPGFMRISEKTGNTVSDITGLRRLNNHMRLDGIGEFDIDFCIDSENNISDFNISGDFFMSEDIDHKIISRLNGIKYDKTEISQALNDMDPESVIPGLTIEKFLALIFKE